MSDQIEPFDPITTLKSLTAADFAELGAGFVGYLAYETDDDGECKIALRSANGTLLATAETLEGAQVAADHFEVEIAITH